MYGAHCFLIVICLFPLSIFNSYMCNHITTKDSKDAIIILISAVMMYFFNVIFTMELATHILLPIFNLTFSAMTLSHTQ